MRDMLAGDGGAARMRERIVGVATYALATALAVAVAETSAADEPAPPKRPNVVLITADTLRADHLSAYGYTGITTPTIDRIASISVRFDRAMTPFPRTTPALGSLMTGLSPQHHGSREVGDPIANGTMLAEILGKHGYATFGVSANWMAGQKQGFDRGFDAFVSLKHHKTDDRGGLVTERLLRMAKLAKPEQPLFAWAHYMDPHFPYHPPKSRDTPEIGLCTSMTRAISKKELSLGVVQGNGLDFGTKTVADCTRFYDAEIAYMDWQIGKLLKGLQELGRLSNVVMVFTADHGEALGEGGLYYEHGTTLQDAVMRVPLLITAPGVEPAVDSELIGLEDLLPTILAVAGIPAEPDSALDGRDQSARLRRGSQPAPAPGRLLFAESGTAMLIGAAVATFEGHQEGRRCIHGPRFSLCRFPDKKPGLYERATDLTLEKDVSAEHPEDFAVLQAALERWPVRDARRRSVRDTRFKLVETPRIEGGYRRALYDLSADPVQTRDVTGEHPEAAARLGAAMDEWTEALPEARAADEPDTEQLELLRALGYVD